MHWRLLASDGAGLDVIFSMSHLACAAAAFLLLSL